MRDDILSAQKMTPHHDVYTCGCVVCYVDRYWAWLDAKRERRAQIARERALFTVEELYDLGGEG